MSPDHQAQLERTVNREAKATLDHPVHLEQLASRDLRAHQVSPETPEHPVLKVTQEEMEYLDLQESPDRKEPQDSQVKEDSLVFPDSLVKGAKLELRGLQDLQETKENQEHQECRESLAPQETPDYQEKMVKGVRRVREEQ